LLQPVCFIGSDVRFALLCSQVCRDPIDLLAEFGKQLNAALPTFVADVAGDLSFFLQLIEGRFQLGVNLE
jgi:hypothetical protein